MGASRGLGIGIAKAALMKAGHAVIATGRDPAMVASAIGNHAQGLCVNLDMTRSGDFRATVEAAVRRSASSMSLVHNPGNFQAGLFGELTPIQVSHQRGTFLHGPMNVVRAR